MDRRALLLGSSSLLVSAQVPINRAVAQGTARPQANVKFDNEKPIPTLDEYRKQVATVTGADFPYEAEIELGNKLLKDIPTDGATPYKVAHRFHEWRRKQVGTTEVERNQHAYYAREWPVRGNPVIMQFFDATGLRNPKGDTTFWCAAFVSWCIARTQAGKTPKVWPYSDGAASAAYRSWGTKIATTDAKKGDLAVFRRTDSAWAGHVGFVDRVEGNTIFVLGGNQGAQNDYNGGEVNIARFSISGGGSLKFDSFRRHAALGVA